MSPESARTERRSRLTVERERELYEAVIELLSEVGYEGLTMDAVAARARSSKATLYRQWRGKPQLVAAALRETREQKFEDIDTGTLVGDLRALVRQAADHQGGVSPERGPSLMRALAHAIDHDPDLGEALREFLESEVAAIQRMVRRAEGRGELPPGRPAAAFLPQMILGPLAFRPMLEGRPADAEYLEEYLNAVMLPALGLTD